MSQTLPPIHEQRILAIFAHPDDEVFCAGGTLAFYALHGAEIIVISATKGQAGQIQNMALARRDTLGDVRKKELYASCQRLGVSHVECWDYPDGALARVERERVIGDVVRAIRQYQPHIVITFGEDGAYGHPDHVAIHQVVTEAFHLAAQPDNYQELLERGLMPYQAYRLYYSYFPHRHELLLSLLVDWLTSQEQRFFGTPEFVAGLSIFARESRMLNYVKDFSEVRWYTQGFCILEQGEASHELFVILSGNVDVYQNTENGSWKKVNELTTGAFFGELGIAYKTPRKAHVVARDPVTCLVFSPSVRSDHEVRGPTHAATPEQSHAEPDIDAGAATHVIDVRDYIRQKVAALAAHQTQFAMTEDMFPLEILEKLFGDEYFVRAYPRRELETLL
ncbi:MAG: PIG-L family deacetylase [Chloroflexi bacterium]|nr:PIG-L family deacetylase [Chloroflexota bacterium]